MFEKIKGLNFDEVTENIKRYLKFDDKNVIKNKYIILPNLNDDETSILNWIEYNEKLGVKNLALDIEAIFFNENRKHIDEKYKKLLSFAKNTITSKGFICNLYSFASQMEYDNKQ